MIKWWLTPKFPDVHVSTALSYKPEGFSPKVRNFYRTWFVHPIRRRVAKFYVRFLQSFFGLKVVGITGSTGKTTTKEMLASILKLEGETVYSFANIDSVYNIPSTILRCRFSTKFLILEMGVEYLNEMDFYLWLVRPKVGIVTNIYATHTFSFKDERGVLREKSKLPKGLSTDGVAVLNSENSHLQELDGKIKAEILWFGKGSKISASNIKYTGDFKTKFLLHIGEENLPVTIPILGRHFVNDALAAATAAYSFQISGERIKKGLQTFQTQAHRMKVRTLKSGAVLIDDSYNSNPGAAKEAITALKVVAGARRTVLVFGDMLELGEREVSYHKEIGEFIKETGIDVVIGVGRLSKFLVQDKKLHADDWDGGVHLVKPFLTRGTVILVKGSRSMNLDKLVQAIGGSR